MKIKHLKAACELLAAALERLANGEITNPQEYARDVLARVRKWYPAEQRMKTDECQESCELGGVHEFADPVQICSKCGTRRLCSPFGGYLATEES